MIQKLRHILKGMLSGRSARMTVDVRIQDCVHHCGFRYGGQQYNPYENYIHDTFLKAKSEKEIKNEFLDFLTLYQPKHIAEALSVELSKEYPLWRYPWHDYTNEDFYRNTWFADPDDVIDILTQKSEKGILSYKIGREFYWLERALRNIMNEGYEPDKYSFIHCLKLEKQDGQARYLILDGNHRTSALYTTGYQHVSVQIDPAQTVREKDSASWPCVKKSFYTEEDALKVFDAYFRGNPSYFKRYPRNKILNYNYDYSDYL